MPTSLGLPGIASSHRVGGRQVDYTYDQLYRLTERTINGGHDTGSTGHIWGYIYDACRQSAATDIHRPGVPAATSTYDANDDSHPMATTTTENTVGPEERLTYDFENRLLSAPWAIEFYDGDGNRVAKTAGRCDDALFGR